MIDLIERLRLLEQDHEPDGWPAVRMRDITELLDALEAARESLDREAALKGGVEHQRDTLWAELEAAREDACVALVADIRFACGDNGKRMQPELVEFIRELAEDAERLNWLASESATLWGSRDRGGYELPYFDITSGRECCDPGDLRAAIDQARGKGVQS